MVDFSDLRELRHRGECTPGPPISSTTRPPCNPVQKQRSDARLSLIWGLELGTMIIETVSGLSCFTGHPGRYTDQDRLLLLLDAERKRTAMRFTRTLSYISKNGTNLAGWIQEECNKQIAAFKGGKSRGEVRSTLIWPYGIPNPISAWCRRLCWAGLPWVDPRASTGGRTSQWKSKTT